MPIIIDGNNTPTAGGAGYGDGTELAFTAAGTSGQVLTSNGASAPAWAAIPAVNLATGVTGTLPVANGGTGLATTSAHALLTGGTTSTGAFQQVSGTGTSGQVLTSNGTGALPTWQALALTTPATVPGEAAVGGQLRISEATANGTNYVGLRAPSSVASDLVWQLPGADGTNGQFLQTNGAGVLSFGSVAANFVFISTATASNSASITFTGLSSTYYAYLIKYSALQQAVGDSYSLRILLSQNNGSSFLSNYAYNGWASGYDDNQKLAGSIDTGFGNYSGPSGNTIYGETILYNPSQSAGYSLVWSQGGYWYSDGTPFPFYRGYFTAGSPSASGACNAIRFYFGAGNITSGTFKLYGITAT